MAYNPTGQYYDDRRGNGRPHNERNQNQYGRANQPQGVPVDFIVPYNFVPFGGAPERKNFEDYYKDGQKLRSGWLDVTLTTKTPLIVPDGAHPTPNPEVKDHKHYDFFRLPVRQPDGKVKSVYAIPGSELRGMLRSYYEAASNSCLPFLKEEKINPTQRVLPTVAFKKRGLLCYNTAQKQWELYQVRVHQIPLPEGTWKNPAFQGKAGLFQGRKNAEEVRFTDENRKVTLYDADHKGGTQGWLQFNNPVSGKARKAGDMWYHISVLEPTGERLAVWPAENPKRGEPYRQLRAVIEQDGVNASAQRNGSQATHEAINKALEKAVTGAGMVPVWYINVDSTDGGEQQLYYFSVASIGRVAQKRTWAEIMGSHAPCKDALCPACLMFGTTAGEGLKGRVRFTDALPETEIKTKEHCLQVLGEPRTTAFEFYMRKPQETNAYKPLFWNYDFHAGQDKMSGDRSFNSLSEATPRGRKFYWHHSIVPDADRKVKMNASMKAADAESRFTFRVYFDGIRDEQLQQLLWTFTLGENEAKSPMQHKLGHAKPLGYGSVKLVVTGGMERCVEVKDGLLCSTVKPLEIPTKMECPFETEAAVLNALKEMSSADTLSAKWKVTGMAGQEPLFTYPRSVKKEEESIFAWFAGMRTNPKYQILLPEPVDTKLWLSGRMLEENLSAWRDGGPVPTPGKQERPDDAKGGKFPKDQGRKPFNLEARQQAPVATADQDPMEGKVVEARMTGMTANRERLFFEFTGANGTKERASIVLKNAEIREKVIRESGWEYGMRTSPNAVRIYIQKHNPTHQNYNAGLAK